MNGMKNLIKEKKCRNNQIPSNGVNMTRKILLRFLNFVVARLV